jgi:hypothetical protein
VKLTIRAPQLNQSVVVELPLQNFASKPAPDFKGFVETDRHIAIEAEHWARDVKGDIQWQVITGYGRTLSGVTPIPVDAPSRLPSADSPRLEYDLFLQSTGEAKVQLVVAPTLGFVPGRGLRCAVSLDDGEPQIIDLLADNSNVVWERAVSDGVRQGDAGKFQITQPGRHVLKIWMVDPGVVFERIVLDLGGIRPSYLGPTESVRLGR